MFKRKDVSFIMIALLLCLHATANGAINPDLFVSGDSLPEINDIETAYEVVCSVGMMHNRISNNTVLPGGTNEWTIVFGDDTGILPSMKWGEPGIYASNNNYLYFGALRIGKGQKLLRLSTETSDTLIVNDTVSDYDTYFYISEWDSLAPEDSLGLGVHQYTHAWSAVDADDFIIYDYWIVNLNPIPVNHVYVALFADWDLSSAGGGSGVEGYWRDDLVAYYRDDNTGEYISYMYDSDSPYIQGNDIGGRLTPRESRGYSGSRLLYCPPIMGSSTPSVQQGHGWWDWNSDPGWDYQWMALMSDSQWLSPPPSPHDFRYLQKLGPFEIGVGDSIRISFAFGIGNGLQGLRSNLSTAKLLFDAGYSYQDIPPTTPDGFNSEVIGNNIEFTWLPNEEPDLAGYNIYSAADPQGPFQAINSALIDTSYFLYRKFERGIYYFYATAVDSDNNESTPSEMVAVSLLPNPPASFRAISGNNIVVLKWNIMPGDDSYKIFKSLVSGGPYTEIAELQYPTNQFEDNNVTNFQTYYYVAKTVDGWYQSPYSGEVEVTPDPSNNGRVLLIDDYLEKDQWGNPLKYQKRRRFYERWGVRNFDYDVWSIADSGMIDSSVIINYQAVVFASDGVLDNADGTWWYDIGAPGQSSVHYYMENGGRLLAIGSQILPWIWNNRPPIPGDFEYEYFGIDSTGDGWDYEWWFTWAIGAEQGYPDSMKIDVAKDGDQDEYAAAVYSLRPDADTLFTWGLWVDGEPPAPEYYQQPIGIIYRPNGTAISALLNFSMYLMPNLDVQLTLKNILRDEFGCTYYEDPSPLPPWELAIEPLVGNELKLTWLPSDEDDITSSRMYRRVNDLEYSYITAIEADISEYIDEDIEPGNIYGYRLSSVDFAGQEGKVCYDVSEIGGRPQMPIGFEAVSGDANVNLSWSHPDDPSIANYSIYRRQGRTGDFTLLTTLPSTDSTYLDNSVINRNIYFYYMKSVSNFGVESHPTETLFTFPVTPGNREGILIVNGVHWPTYGSQIINMYQQNALTGTYDYSFWDLFDMPPMGWPHPENVLGSGPVPETFFDAFQTIIWVGNNYNGDLIHWQNNHDNIMACLNSGGNIILTGGRGNYFFWDELCTYAGIDPDGFLTGINPNQLISAHDSLIDMNRIGSLSYTALATVIGDSTTTLFEAPNYSDYAAGLITGTPGSGGQFAYIAGRIYRYNLNDLEQNFETILRYFLGMPNPRFATAKLEVPKDFVLYQNYPNPFNPTTIIKFGLPEKSDVRLEIFDILGRVVNVLSDGELEAGYHEIIWDGNNNKGSDIASGVYFYKLETKSFTNIKKMLLLK